MTYVMTVMDGSDEMDDFIPGAKFVLGEWQTKAFLDTLRNFRMVHRHGTKPANGVPSDQCFSPGTWAVTADQCKTMVHHEHLGHVMLEVVLPEIKLRWPFWLELLRCGAAHNGFKVVCSSVVR
jgi:hypothetical protein